MAITDYKSYMRQLEKIYDLHGHAVSDAVLQSFIDSEKIGTRFGITIQDVKADLATIRRRHSTSMKGFEPSYKATPQVSSPIPQQCGIKTYSQYMGALERLYISKGKVQPSDADMILFIKNNGLDTAFDITLTDVKADFQKILRKYNLAAQKNKQLTAADVGHDMKNSEESDRLRSHVLSTFEDYSSALSDFIAQYGDKAFLDIYVKKFLVIHNMEPNNPALLSDVRMDLVFTHSKVPLNSATANSLKKKASKQSVQFQGPHPDEEFCTAIADIISKHRELLSHSQLLKGILWDYFPTRKREINILMTYVDYGMLNEINQVPAIDAMLVERYVTRIVNEYGIDKELAAEMALVWCRGYGESVLGKNVVK